MTEEKTLIYEQMTDMDLFPLLQKGDRDAFSQIYRRYAPVMFTLAFRYIKCEEDAKDIIQTIFLKLWQIKGELKPIHNIRGYLYSMTRNAVMNFIRDRNASIQKNYRLAQLQGLIYDGGQASQEQDETLSKMKRAIDRLPEQQRRVALFRSQGLSNKEIAELLHLSLNTVNTHYTKGLKKLKTTFLP